MWRVSARVRRGERARIGVVARAADEVWERASARARARERARARARARARGPGLALGSRHVGTENTEVCGNQMVLLFIFCCVAN